MCLGGYSSIPVGGESDFFFLPHSCHVDPFTFHISLPNLKFTIFIHLSQTQVNYTSLSFVSNNLGPHVHISVYQSRLFQTATPLQPHL